jgi:predicted PurR-regulated permease PerM
MGVLAGVAVGVLAGVLNFIPYVGTSIGAVLAFGLLILDGASVYVLCGAVATFGVVQTLEGYVITPQIVGDKVGLSTLAVILALSIGGQLFGLLGMLLALPGAGVCMAFWPDIRKIYTRSEFFRGSPPGGAEG